jgi:hypothetical protein
MKKPAFCLITTWLSFSLLPLQGAGATTVKTDLLLASRPFQYIENKAARLKTIKIYAIDTSKPSSAQKEKIQIEEQGPGNHGKK